MRTILITSMLFCTTKLLGFTVPAGVPGWTYNNSDGVMWARTEPTDLVLRRYDGEVWRWWGECGDYGFVLSEADGKKFCVSYCKEGNKINEYYKESIIDGILLTEYFFKDMVVATFKNDEQYRFMIKAYVK